MSKFMKKIVTVVLTFIMVLGMAISASAGSIAAPPALNEEGKALIQKVLKVPVGAAKPTEDFKFEFVPKGITSNINGALIENTADPGYVAPASMPLPGVDTAGVGVATIPHGTINADDPAISGGYQIFKGSIDAFVGTNPGTDPTITGQSFPHAGVYVYEVTELPPTTPTAGMKYSGAKYEMYVYVINDESNFGTQRIISDVGFRIISTDGPNIDPLDMAPIVTEAPNPESGTSSTAPKAEPVFTNRYTPPADLEISKEVASDYADTTKLFTYTLEVTRPQVAADADGAQTYTGTIYEADGTTAAGKVIVTFGVNDIIGTVTTAPASTSSGTFKLSHGQKLDFLADNREPVPGSREGLPMGSTWKLTEAGEARYKATVAIINNGEGKSTAATTEGEDLTIASTTSGNLILGNHEDGNSAAWTNIYLDVTPTGILISNLPFIMLIVVAVGGFVLYIASKRRKATN